VTAQVAAGEFRQRAIAIHINPVPEPICDQGIRVFTPDHRAAHRNPFKACTHQQVDQRLALSAHPGSRDPFSELHPGERAVLGERPRDDVDAPFGGSGVDSLLSQTPGVGRRQRRRRERMKPAVVLAADQMQRPTVEPSDEKRSIDGQRPVDVCRR
jgi:hypothetical protein